MNIWVINGPNLGRLDLRDSATYGDISYADLVSFCEKTGKELGHTVSVFQSDDETEIIHLFLHFVDTPLTPSPLVGRRT